MSRPSRVVGLDGPASSVCVGATHACALLTTGQVECWGTNLFGLLGDGTTVSRTKAARVRDVDNAKEIVCSNGHTCARLGDGSVACWGINTNGQLGDGTRDDRLAPVHPKLEPVIALAAGVGFTCAIARDGRVWCWGYQAGPGDVDLDTPTIIAGIRGATAITAFRHRTCVRAADATVTCWSDAAHPAPVPMLGGNDIRAFNAACAAHATGEIRCDETQLVPIPGDPTEPVHLPGVTTFVTSGLTTCALALDALWCWGRNRRGEVGDGTTERRTEPTRVEHP